MATTAQHVPGFLAHGVSDAMDLHSDDGIDFGDADADIDLDIRSPLPGDDDVSVHDIDTVSLHDAQIAPTDVDDLMADGQDVVEEDLIGFEGEAAENSHVSVAAGQVKDYTGLDTADDDLIDYSDDEEQTTPASRTFANNVPEVEESDQLAIGEILDPAASNDEMINLQAETSSNLEHVDEPEAAKVDVADETLTNVEAAPTVHPHNSATSVSRGTNAQELNSPTSATGSIEVLAREQAVGTPQDDGSPLRQEALSQQHSKSHQITVNYNGAELWLFKHHDHDDSGDFVVEDDMLLEKPINQLLEACRTALGAELAETVELGFRLDCLHNMELYQEHTSCAFITLQHIVDLYLQLQAQDGNIEPESFYMTLLFRPRISALLHELSKAAVAGIGASGLERAIAAGETAFHSNDSHASTQNEEEEWTRREDEKLQQADQEGNDAQTSFTHNDEPYVEFDEGALDTLQHEDDASEHGEHVRGHSEEEGANSKLEAMGGPSNEALVEKSSVTNPEDVHHSVNEAAQFEPDDGDVLDYSDDEADANATNDLPAFTEQHSTPSSTIQGDDAAHDVNDDSSQEHADATKSQEHYSGEAADGYDEDPAVDENVGAQGFVEEEDQNIYTHDHTFATTYEQDGYSSEYPLQNQDDYTNVNDENGADPSGPFTNSEATGGNADEQPPHMHDAIDGVIGASDFVDFDAAVDATYESNLGQNEYEVDNEFGTVDNAVEEGDADESLVAASTAAAASHTNYSPDLLNLSPQGQKRTIDEVGNDAAQALGSTDTKRPRV